MRSEANQDPGKALYLENLFTKIDPEFEVLLSEARKNSDTLNKTQISLSNNEARLLSALVRIHRPRKFIEIGTLTGYSALWIAIGMQEGELYTLEKDPKHAEMAMQTLQKLKTQVEIEVINEDAKDALEGLSKKAPFDGIFIDGNKAAYCDYLDWAEKNLKQGGLILADNVFAGGGVYGQPDGRFTEKMITVMKEFNRRLADPEKYFSILIPTLEGLFVAVKK